MRTKKIIAVIILAAAIGACVWVLIVKKEKASQQVTKTIRPFIGTIKTFISSTGTVLPKNRLEVKPPVNGRIESIEVQEGQMVKTGQILAWMSSTDRAALLDAARGKGEQAFKYWEETYKPIALLAPIDGEVIVSRLQPGTTIATSDDVVVLSDHLIIRAQVDETDIGKIKLGQKAQVSLDAYPDKNIDAAVDHIYYESLTVNNVTIYQVDLVPQDVPSFFRSGMNATVNFIDQDRENVLLVPADAVQKDASGSYVFVKHNGDKEPVMARVETGISDDKNTEIISGITENDRIITKAKKYSLPKSSTGTNPFMPARRR